MGELAGTGPAAGACGPARSAYQPQHAAPDAIACSRADGPQQLSATLASAAVPQQVGCAVLLEVVCVGIAELSQQAAGRSAEFGWLSVLVVDEVMIIS